MPTFEPVPEADKSELEAFDKVFCNNRDVPLMVGSVMSNIGYGEAASGISAVTKVLIGYHRGELAGNLYCESPRSDVAAIKEGRIQVLNENRKFRRTYAAINGMSVTGINAHVLLHGHYKPKVAKLCPPEIETACHNSADSCTISGPYDSMKSFVSELVAKGIFAKEVPCSNIAYHSRYIAEAGPGLLKYLTEVIKTPKVRSDKWVSTSVSQDRWDEDLAKYSSAEYHTNNLLSPVLFEEASKLIPSNAVLVEIAPHGLLQAILKRSLPESCVNISLTRRGYLDGSWMVLESVGKLYMEGYDPNVQVLYPKVEFPVSTGTPYLSCLVDWAHDEKWPLPLYASAHRVVSASCKFLVSVHDDSHNYLRGHIIREKMLLPFSYALVAAWDTLAMSLKVPKKSLSVVFNNVHLYAQPVLHDQKSIKLVVSLHRGSGQFEVMDNSFKVATGFISSDDKLILKSDVKSLETDYFSHNSQDIYQLFYEREYSYSGQFRSIHSANDDLTEAYVVWNDNWVTFIDGLLQLNAFKHPHDAVSEPSQIRKITIDLTKHAKQILLIDDVTAVLRAYVSKVHNFTRCSGVLLETIKFRDLPPSSKKQVDLQTLQFVPRFEFEIDRDDEFVVNQTFLYIVPGLEGHHKRFSSLCEQLKLSALVLQLGLDHLQDTVEDLALRYSDVVLKRVGFNKRFHILGYETGVLVALELAAILEQHGQIGTIFCIGDGPEEIMSLIKEQLREFKSQEALQIGLVQHMFTLMTGRSAWSMMNVEGVTWRHLVDTCVRTLLGHVPHSAQYARALIEAAYARIGATINCKSNSKLLKSKIVLLRAVSPYTASNTPCSLQRYSEQPISIHNLTTPLAHATHDLRCASIINKHLSDDVLDAFDSKNLCETYLLNADTFFANSHSKYS